MTMKKQRKSRLTEPGPTANPNVRYITWAEMKARHPARAREIQDIMVGVWQKQDRRAQRPLRPRRLILALYDAIAAAGCSGPYREVREPDGTWEVLDWGRGGCLRPTRYKAWLKAGGRKVLEDIWAQARADN